MPPKKYYFFILFLTTKAIITIIAIATIIYGAPVCGNNVGFSPNSDDVPEAGASTTFTLVLSVVKDSPDSVTKPEAVKFAPSTFVFAINVNSTLFIVSVALAPET